MLRNNCRVQHACSPIFHQTFPNVFSVRRLRSAHGLRWRGYGPVERKPVRTKAQQNEIPIERNPIRTTTRQKESPTERKAQFEPVYNKLCVGTVFVASGNVRPTTET